MIKSIGWSVYSIFYDFFIGEVDRRLYEEVIESLGNLGGVKIDEFGCGTGNLTSKFPDSAEVRVIDFSPVAISIAKTKVGKKARFFVMDFYKELPLDYKPDKIVACRSIYCSDLSRSLNILSNHVSDNGLVIIAHPHEKWNQYINPKLNGKNKLDLTQLSKSVGRLTNHVGIPYSLFRAEEFEKAGRQYFDEVKIKLAAYETHYLISLKKG